MRGEIRDESLIFIAIHVLGFQLPVPCPLLHRFLQLIALIEINSLQFIVTGCNHK